MYKQNRRSRYIDQRNKQLRLVNGSTTSFLPNLYYETSPSTKPDDEELIDEAIQVESNENILESPLTPRSIHRFSNTNLSTGFDLAESRINSNSDLINRNTADMNSNSKDSNTKLKEKCSNVTTDSAISSLSSSSR